MNELFLLKLFHVLSVVMFAGGTLILSRVIASSKKGSDEFKQTVSGVVLRIYKIAVLPLGVVLVATGLRMVMLNPGLMAADTAGPWLHIKLTLVLILIVADQIFFGMLRKAARGEIPENWGRFNMVHGISGLAFIGILVCVYILRYTMIPA